MHSSYPTQQVGGFDLRISHDEEDPEANIPARSIISYCPLDRALMKIQHTGIVSVLHNRSIDSRIVPPSREYRAIERFVQHQLEKMLNSKELTKVLNANVHRKLFPQWLYVFGNLND